jgi:hypothetical protein
MEAGASESKEDFTMAGFMDGKYCGACHDGSTAFHTNSPEKCATCHTPPGTIVFTKPVKAVVFDHKMHVDDLGFNCTNCHSDLFKMTGDAEKNEQGRSWFCTASTAAPAMTANRPCLQYPLQCLHNRRAGLDRPIR